MDLRVGLFPRAGRATTAAVSPRALFSGRNHVSRETCQRRPKTPWAPVRPLPAVSLVERLADAGSVPEPPCPSPSPTGRRTVRSETLTFHVSRDR